MKKEIKGKIDSWLSSEDPKPNKSVERVSLRVVPKKRGRKGYIVKIVFKLINYMYHRLRKLTSTRRSLHFGARNLKIFIRYRAWPNRLRIQGPSEPKKLKIYEEPVALRSASGRGDLFIDFWHHLSKTDLKLQVVEVCKRVPRRIFAAAQYIGMDASGFEPLHIGKWIADTDMKIVEETTKKMVAEGKTCEDIIFQPSEFLSICDDYNYPPKIPLRRPSLGYQFCPPANKRRKNGESSDVEVVFQKNPKGMMVDHSRLRQTHIEEFFKPRRLMTTTMLTTKNEKPSAKGA